MIFHRWGLIDYAEAREKMENIHAQASTDGQNHLIFCEHYNVFTVGSNDHENWPVPIIKTDRGGSITCHSPGQLVSYFCFQAPRPAVFYRKVIGAYSRLFELLNLAAKYNKKNPGFYIQNRKIASLGFRYKNGVSLHGVALNVNVDLAFHSLVNPCGLEGVIPTSLKAEGKKIVIKDIEDILFKTISEAFDETI